jgi:hypothetical protein
MIAKVIPLNRQHTRAEVQGDRGPLTFHVSYRIAQSTKGECASCGGKTRRNRYGILHADCSGCRYLKMIYGPSIKIERRSEAFRTKEDQGD